MAVSVEDVKHWHLRLGIGHVVVTDYKDGWIELACRTVCTGDVTEVRPNRICRKCRERLKDAIPC